MRKRIRAAGVCLYCVAFFASCLFFSLGMLIPGLSYAAEGSERPHLIRENRVSSTFGDELEVWFSRNFAGRSAVVDAFSAIREKVFSAGNDQVLVGKDGFLFFRETEADYTGSSPMTEEELNEAADSLAAMQRYSAEHGAAFLFLCAPNKNTVYPDKMPDRYRRSAEPSDLDRLYLLLEEKDVPYLDVRELLRNADEQVYHKRDTHWNAAGARMVYLAVMEKLGLTACTAQNGTELISAPFSADLNSLLYPGRTEPEAEPVYDNAGQFAYTSAFSSPMDMIITTRSDGEGGSLLLFRDSFGSALCEDFAVGFRETHLERALPYRLDLMETSRTDVVIVELAERNLRSLIGADERIAGNDNEE